MRNTPHNTPLAALLVLALSTAALHAQRNIGFRSTPGSTNYTSAGAPVVLDGEFVFELGAFGSGFTPTASNTADWAANWTPLGRAQYQAGLPRWFSKTATLENNNAPFNIGNQGYIWGHNGDGEWILMENASWTWPEAVGGISPGGTTFSVANPGTTAIVGAVNPAGSPFHMMTAVATGPLPDIVPEHWYIQNFSSSELGDPTISGPLSDPDDDGAVNLLEMAAGTDPNDPTSFRFPEVDFYPNSGSVFVRARLERAGRALITHALALSTDLMTWDNSNSGVTVVSDTTNLLILDSTAPVGTFPREFYRFTLDDN